MIRVNVGPVSFSVYTIRSARDNLKLGDSSNSGWGILPFWQSRYGDYLMDRDLQAGSNSNTG